MSGRGSSTEPEEATPLDAAGTRARVVERDGVLHVQVDGGWATVEVVYPRRDRAGAGERRATRWLFGAERTSAAPDGSGLLGERVFAAPDAPLVVLEWEAHAAPTELRLRLRQADDIRLDPPLGTSMIDDELRLTLVPGQPARVVVQPASGSALDTDALMAAARARARRRAALRPKLESARGDVLADAERALRSSLVRSAAGLRVAAPGDEGEARTALALLAVSEPELARAVLAAERIEAGAVALVAGAWAAWTGDGASLDRAWPGVAAWLDEALRRPSPFNASPAVRGAALSLAPAVAELMADRELSLRLRQAALPDAASALAALAEGDAAARPGAPRDAAAGTGSLRDAAAEVLGRIHGEAGVVPDAPRGRVRLGPRASEAGMHLTGLRVGDAVFSMRAVVASPGQAWIALEQTAGATPFTLIVEPWLRARRLIAASVDGVEAQLDSRVEAEGLRARVQLVADHERRILLEFE